MNEYDFEYKPRDLENDRTALMEAKELIKAQSIIKQNAKDAEIKEEQS